jgi:hypothetical protein
MFYHRNGTELVVNCAVIPNSDISGVGVRSTFYIQAVVLILLSLLKVEPKSLFLSNLSIQVTSAALIGAVYFDPTVDVPHTILASQFVVLFSACRSTTYDLPSSILRDRNSIKTICQAWVLDIFFRTTLLIFNYSIWSNIIATQKESSVCADGSDKAGHDRLPTTFAYLYCILDILWEISRFTAHIARTVFETSSGLTFDPFDPRFWVFQKAIQRISGIDIAKRYGWLEWGACFRKVLIFAITVTLVEMTVLGDGLVQGENHWTFGQIFQMINLVCLLSVLISRYSSTFFVRSMIHSAEDACLLGCLIIGVPLGMWFLVELNVRSAPPGRVWPSWGGLSFWGGFFGCVLAIYGAFRLVVFGGRIVRKFLWVIVRQLGLSSITKWASCNLLVPMMRIFGYALGLIEVPEHQPVTTESDTVYKMISI